MKTRKPNMEELKKLYKNQCSPCIKGYPECKGNKKKAKEWDCPQFYSGFFIGEL